MPDPIISYKLFDDGSIRPVFEQRDGRQYVLDDDAERVYGSWILPDDGIDLPIIVDAKQS